MLWSIATARRDVTHLDRVPTLRSNALWRQLPAIWILIGRAFDSGRDTALPAEYSPYLNPIETPYSRFKTCLRKSQREPSKP